MKCLSLHCLGRAIQRSRSGADAANRNALKARLAIEALEPRLVFAVQLAPGPQPDVVTVAPAPQANQFVVTTGPAQRTSLGPSWGASFANGVYQTTAPNLTVESANFIAIDLTKTYALSGWTRSGDEFGQRYQPNNPQSFGYTSYDIDHHEILPENALRFAGSTDTTLAAPLNPGDTAIHLTKRIRLEQFPRSLRPNPWDCLVRIHRQHGINIRQLHLHAQRCAWRCERFMGPRGRVFKLLNNDGTPLHGGRCTVGKIVSDIGRSANVVVNDAGKPASAHDLRRAFGQRWAGRVMPTILLELMRHEDIGTTMKFYVGQNAEATADVLWETLAKADGRSALID